MRAGQCGRPHEKGTPAGGHPALCIRSSCYGSEKIDRINELARKAKAEGLTEEEQKEREVLRQEYLDAIMGNLRRELDNTYIVDEHGNKRKLQGKGFKS